MKAALHLSALGRSWFGGGTNVVVRPYSAVSQLAIFPGWWMGLAHLARPHSLVPDARTTQAPLMTVVFTNLI